MREGGEEKKEEDRKITRGRERERDIQREKEESNRWIEKEKNFYGSDIKPKIILSNASDMLRLLQSEISDN